MIRRLTFAEPSANGKAKPYQVKQIRQLILKYKLNFDYDE